MALYWHFDEKEALLAAVADRYPHIAASAGYLTDCETPESYVMRGCDAIIAGVRAQAPSS